MLENIYVMLFNTIEKVCFDCNSVEQSKETQIILSKIFNTMLKAGLIHTAAINMAMLDLISNILLSDHIKGMSCYL